ncbi:hypothetical protein CEXT_302011 [Caerostris extrusa]|uniref:Uncharacterized protein n=1 Tax=Caerostris extrusa TaxID=172846 RepID=A0AAV4VHN1_CAEEX|nr:hypothetical protein CEXT_302011 [Caerostris extrusa]
MVISINAISTKALLIALPCFSADPPEEPKNCEVTNSTAKCILVECTKDQDEGPEQLFQLDVFDTSSKELLINITDFNPEFRVCSLPAESSFYYYCTPSTATEKARGSKSMPTLRASMGTVVSEVKYLISSQYLQ